MDLKCQTGSYCTEHFSTQQQQQQEKLPFRRISSSVFNHHFSEIGLLSATNQNCQFKTATSTAPIYLYTWGFFFVCQLASRRSACTDYDQQENDSLHVLRTLFTAFITQWWWLFYFTSLNVRIVFSKLERKPIVSHKKHFQPMLVLGAVELNWKQILNRVMQIEKWIWNLSTQRSGLPFLKTKIHQPKTNRMTMFLRCIDVMWFIQLFGF